MDLNETFRIVRPYTDIEMIKIWIKCNIEKKKKQ